MTSFARRWLAVGLVPGLMGAAADSLPVPAPLSARVAEAVARAWRVPADAVRLAWPRTPAPAGLDPEAPLRLTGRGLDGWFAVVLRPGDAEATAFRVRAGVEDTVVVAARPLAAGALITADDLRLEPRPHCGPPSGERAARPEPGWEIRRPLATGEIVAWPAVAAPPLVATGRPVQFVWERGGVLVSVRGMALHSARRGDVVRARVDGRPGRLSGTVTAPGTAVLEGGTR